MNWIFSWHKLNTYPVATSHILIVLSREADTRWSPDGKKSTEEILWSWPCKVFKHSYVWKSHIFTVMSAEQEAKRRFQVILLIYVYKRFNKYFSNLMTQSAKKIYYGENNFYQKRTIKILKKNLTRSLPQLFFVACRKIPA